VPNKNEEKGAAHKAKPLQMKSALFLSSYRDNGALLAGLAESCKTDNTVSFCVQRVVAAAADILTRMDVSAALSVQNIASLNELSICSLRTKSLGFGIASVLRGTDTFLMREELKIHIQHVCTSLNNTRT
jgi:hypothetical protein